MNTTTKNTTTKKKDIYEEWRSYQNDMILLRPVELSDSKELFLTYSDKKSQELFNCDNFPSPCYFDKPEQMETAVEYYIKAHEIHEFIRWTIVYRPEGRIIGTIENFYREIRDEKGEHPDLLSDTALLRIDLKSEFETEEVIEAILDLVIDTAYDDFHCDFIATKAIEAAACRRAVLKKKGFMRINENIGALNDYYITTRITKEQLEKSVPCGGECSGCEHFNKDCEGCRKTDGCVAMWDKKCAVYQCAKEHNAYICGLCDEFPCDWLRDKISGWNKEGINILKRYAVASHIMEIRKNG